jgi:transposase-like protein
MAKGKYYTPEFKEQAVKMVVESTPSRTTGSVACELDVNETTLGCWVTAYRRQDSNRAHNAVTCHEQKTPSPAGQPRSKLTNRASADLR